MVKFFRNSILMGVLLFLMILSAIGCSGFRLRAPECVVCPPPINLGSNTESMEVSCTEEIEGCFGFQVGRDKFYRCKGGEWKELPGIPGV